MHRKFISYGAEPPTSSVVVVVAAAVVVGFVLVCFCFALFVCLLVNKCIFCLNILRIFFPFFVCFVLRLIQYS